jgi:hypothetical protein
MARRGLPTNLTLQGRAHLRFAPGVRASCPRARRRCGTLHRVPGGQRVPPACAPEARAPEVCAGCAGVPPACAPEARAPEVCAGCAGVPPACAPEARAPRKGSVPGRDARAFPCAFAPSSLFLPLLPHGECPTRRGRSEEAPENAHAVRGFSPGDATRCTHPWRVQRGHRDGRRAAGRGRHGSGNPSAPWSGVVHRRPDGDACAGHTASGYDRRSGAAVAARVRPGKNGIRIGASSRITCGRFERARARRCAAVESSADHGRRVCQLRLPDDCAHQGVRSPSTSRC